MRRVLLLSAMFHTVLAGCGTVPGVPLPNESTEPVDAARFELIARLVHISDAHLVDEESPGRLTVLASLSGSAWRPQEAYATQLLDGMIRTVNKMHATGRTIDFLVHTGDASDNAQSNELQWFIAALDGLPIHPRTGPDDRLPAAKPERLLDPHAPFLPQGLYRNGVHGTAPTIPWYNVLGNHDHFAVGVFPIVTGLLGRRTSPLPLQERIGAFLPVSLDPTGVASWGSITPAHPGPPPEINLPKIVTPNPARRFLTDHDFIAAHLQSETEPKGHGFSAAAPNRPWYSVVPLPGLRLIGLNSASPAVEEAGFVYSEGAISWPQVAFLKQELSKATRRDEIVIVATHHPSSALDVTTGTALTQHSLVRLLNDHPCVKLHLAGHLHNDVVMDRSGYVEIVTSSIIDAPQQGRVIEIWRSGDAVELRYWLFSHLDDIESPDESDAALFADPLLPLRRVAAGLAGVP